MLQGAPQQRRIGRIAYIHAENPMARFQQAQTQMGPDEARTSQYDDSFLHRLLLFRGSRSKIYSIKSARGSSPMWLMGTTSMPLGRLIPGAR